MNPYNFSTLLFAFGSFFIGLLIFLKRQDRVGITFFVFSIFASIWGIGYAIMISPNVSYETALYSARISQGLTMFVSYFWLELSLTLTHQAERWKEARKILFIFLLSLQLITWHPLFIPTVEPAVGFRYYTRPGLLYHFHTLFYFTLVPMGAAIQIFRALKTKSREEKKLLVGLFASTMFGFIGGAFCFLPVYGIMAPQYGLFLIPAYPFVLAYFMIRQRIFDMEELAQTFQKEKLATLGLLTASINHEIRNPLYAVKGLLETYIENEKEGVQRKTPLETSERALKQIRRALEVIQKLNRFSKPTNEISSLENASLQEAVRAVLDLVSYEFSLGKIEIKNLLTDDSPRIQADQRQLEEILFNLIVNACQAMKEGGELVISAATQNDKITVTISDTGTGIPEDQAKRLFEPFHTTKGEKGTGLGLYITKQLIERNNGRISVQSKPGQGTSFTLEFKRA